MSDESDESDERAFGDGSSEYAMEIDVRLRDIDFMGHVNNAVYATYLEEAREAYFRDVVGISLTDVGTVLAALEIDYSRPIEADAAVTVAVRVSDLGTSSLSMGYEIRTDGKPAATARTVQVLVDRETGETRPIPDEWRSKIDTASD